MAQDVAANAIGAWLHGLATGAANMAVGAHNYVMAQPTLQQGVSDFVRGLVNGAPAAPAASAPAKVAAPAAPATPKAPVYTPAFLATQPNFVQQFNASNPDKAVTDAPSSGAPAPPTPLDVIRAAAMNNGGLSLNQLASLSESVARTVPQAVKPVPLTSKEQAGAQYLSSANDYAMRMAMNPAYAATDTGKAHAQLLANLRALASVPNPINDAATGMPLQVQGQ
jgi:hypothetical protein